MRSPAQPFDQDRVRRVALKQFVLFGHFGCEWCMVRYRVLGKKPVFFCGGSVCPREVWPEQASLELFLRVQFLGRRLPLQLFVHFFE